MYVGDGFTVEIDDIHFGFRNIVVVLNSIVLMVENEDSGILRSFV